MPNILSKAYKAVFKDSNSDTEYWTHLGYHGYLLDEHLVIQAAKDIKAKLYESVIRALPSEHQTLSTSFLEGVVSTTLFEEGFLATPLEALEQLRLFQDTGLDYRIAVSFISPILIKERVRRYIAQQGNPEKGEGFIVDKVLNLLGVPQFDSFGESSEYEIAKCWQSALVLYKQGYSRKSIFERLRAEYTLHLKGLHHYKGYYLQHLSDTELVAYKEYLRAQLTANYYEPLIYSRYSSSKLQEGMASFQDSNNLKFIEYADTYSKLVRLGNIRRRLVLQDMRYVILEAVYTSIM